MINNGFVIRQHVKITSHKKRGPRKTRTVYVWFEMKNEVFDKDDVRFILLGGGGSAKVCVWSEMENEVVDKDAVRFKFLGRRTFTGSEPLSRVFVKVDVLSSDEPVKTRHRSWIGGRRNRRGAFRGSEPL
jgi:hypothetical protein